MDAALRAGSEYLEYAKEEGVAYPNVWIQAAEDSTGGSKAIESGEFEIEFEVTDDTIDEVVNTLIAIILTVSPKTVQALATRVAEEVLGDSEKDALGRRRRSLDEQILDSWRSFLSD